MSVQVTNYSNKKLVADALVAIGVCAVLYAYLAIPGDTPKLSPLEKILMMGGFLAMLAHYGWMLAAVVQHSLGSKRVTWFLLVAMTFTIGSYLFYFKVYRPMLLQKC